MVYESLIAIVEKKVDNLADKWTKEVNKCQYLQTYRALSPEELFQRGQRLFTNLLNWLETGASNDDAANYFQKVGRDRIAEGFPLTEIYYALYLEKKVLWSSVAKEEDITGKLHAVDAIEFMSVINNYFDLGSFYIIRGYMNMLFSELSDSKKFSQAELEQLLTKGALFQESLRNVEDGMYGEGLHISILR